MHQNENEDGPLNRMLLRCEWIFMMVHFHCLLAQNKKKITQIRTHCTNWFFPFDFFLFITSIDLISVIRQSASSTNTHTHKNYKNIRSKLIRKHGFINIFTSNRISYKWRLLFRSPYRIGIIAEQNNITSDPTTNRPSQRYSRLWSWSW